MNMSNTERLILSNQYEILGNSSEKADVLPARQHHHRARLLSADPRAGEELGHLDLATCQEVIDTLELHHALAILLGQSGCR